MRSSVAGQRHSVAMLRSVRTVPAATLTSPATHAATGTVQSVKEWLPVGYFHVVFTLPAPIADIAYQNKRVVYDLLMKAHSEGRLNFFGQHAGLSDRATFDVFLKPLRKSEWDVYAKSPFGGPEAVLAYLAHYTHPLPGRRCKATLRGVSRSRTGGCSKPIAPQSPSGSRTIAPTGRTVTRQ